MYEPVPAAISRASADNRQDLPQFVVPGNVRRIGFLEEETS
jgi:hypothetical protein